MLRFIQQTERGGGHANNEDYLLRGRHTSGRDRFLCFIADGQGGRADAALASRIACEAAMAAAQGHSWEDLFTASVWDEIFAEADRNVEEKCEGFTTLIGIAIDEGSITGGSVGDSKAYSFDGSDQFVELTARQHKNPPIGGGCGSAHVFHLPKFAGVILLVTDGVWKYAGFDALRACVAGPVEQIVDGLRAATLSRQGGSFPDDFTVLAATNSAPMNTEQGAVSPGSRQRI